jgi:hypothetical protein
VEAHGCTILGSCCAARVELRPLPPAAYTHTARFARSWARCRFATYNTLQELVPKREDVLGKLSRNAAIGFVSSVVSDSLSNSIRVIKTYRQTSLEPVSYQEAVRR